jgi:hypothetical protein
MTFMSDEDELTSETSWYLSADGVETNNLNRHTFVEGRSDVLFLIYAKHVLSD